MLRRPRGPGGFFSRGIGLEASRVLLAEAKKKGRASARPLSVTSGSLWSVFLRPLETRNLKLETVLPQLPRVPDRSWRGVVIAFAPNAVGLPCSVDRQLE